MTEDQVTYLTNAVVAALDPKLSTLHGRVTDVALDVSRMQGKISEMPTREDMHNSISQHTTSCTQRRQWGIGAAMAIPALIAAVASVISLLVR